MVAGDHYSTVGANYENLDPFKRMCQMAMERTSGGLSRLGLRDFSPSRGESCSLVEAADHYLGLVVEGLGTKNRVAQAMQDLTNSAEWWRPIGQDTLAMILNDLICLGARPASVVMYAAVGHDNWFDTSDPLKLSRMEALIGGWADGCTLCGCLWNGGETPCLKQVIVEGEIDLAGAAYGIVSPKSDLLIGRRIEVGDLIIIVASSSIHANAISAARDVADNILPQGYLTPCGNSTFGAQILKPTVLYSPLVERWLDARDSVELHYAINITGHGWKKLMRAEQPFQYVVNHVPEPYPIFRLIQEAKSLEAEEMYRTYNMNAGYAVIIRKSTATATLAIAHEMGYNAWVAGEVCQATNGRKSVYIRPLGIIYDDLGVR